MSDATRDSSDISEEVHQVSEQGTAPAEAAQAPAQAAPPALAAQAPAQAAPPVLEVAWICPRADTWLEPSPESGAQGSFEAFLRSAQAQAAKAGPWLDGGWRWLSSRLAALELGPVGAEALTPEEVVDRASRGQLRRNVLLVAVPMVLVGTALLARFATAESGARAEFPVLEDAALAEARPTPPPLLPASEPPASPTSKARPTSLTAERPANRKVDRPRSPRAVKTAARTPPTRTR